MGRCKDTVRESARGLTLLCMTPFRRKTLLAARTPARLRAPLCTEPCLSADPACCRTSASPPVYRTLPVCRPCLSPSPGSSSNPHPCTEPCTCPPTPRSLPEPYQVRRHCHGETLFGPLALPSPPPSEPPIKPVEPKFGVDNPLFTGAGLVTRPLIPGVVTYGGGCGQRITQASASEKSHQSHEMASSPDYTEMMAKLVALQDAQLQQTNTLINRFLDRDQQRQKQSPWENSSPHVKSRTSPSCSRSTDQYSPLSPVTPTSLNIPSSQCLERR